MDPLFFFFSFSSFRGYWSTTAVPVHNDFLPILYNLSKIFWPNKGGWKFRIVFLEWRRSEANYKLLIQGRGKYEKKAYGLFVCAHSLTILFFLSQSISTTNRRMYSFFPSSWKICIPFSTGSFWAFQRFKNVIFSSLDQILLFVKGSRDLIYVLP